MDEKNQYNLTLLDFIQDATPINNELEYETDETYKLGMEILTQCYDECLLLNQNGGADKEIIASSKIVTKIFSPQTKASITRTMRGILRTSTGISADILTLGAGGDVVVNSLFAIESSLTFLTNIEPLLVSFEQARELFDVLIRIDRKKTIPIESKIKLDDGFQEFENIFSQILIAHTFKHGTKMLDSAHLNIVAILDKITTTVSDWIACLFPDTAGLAGEISKTILDYITLNGYTYIYQLVGMLSDNTQKMITDPYALEKLVRSAIKELRNIILTMDTKQIAKLVQSIGMAAADFTGSTLVKGAMRIGTSITGIGIKNIKIPSNFATDKAREMLAYIIDKYVIPYVDEGVDLFYQLFPIYLMFTLFVEKYPQIINSKYLLEKK